MDRNLVEAIEKLEKRSIDPSKVLVGLTGVEKSILNVLIDYEQAMNPNEIRNVLISDVWTYLLCLLDENIRKRIGDYKLKYWRSEFHFPTNEKEVLNFWRQNKDLPRSKEYELIAKFLKKEGIANIPNHRTIERILKELEMAGIVVSRDEVGKAKKVYFVNPIILKKLK